jgi:hypothetical protein
MSEVSAERKVKAHCPTCKDLRFADIVSKYDKRFEDEYGMVWEDKSFQILKCCGCDEIYFRIVTVFSEDVDYKENPITGEFETYVPEKITYWPAPTRRSEPAWSHKIRFRDATLRTLFSDIYTALNSDLPVLAAIAMRTMFDRASERLGVDPSVPLSKINSSMRGAFLTFMSR